MAQIYPVVKFRYIFVVFIILFACENVLAESCTSDNDCVKPNMYCYTSGECASCLDCSIYKRHPGQGCAKTKNHCGECLPGTEADPNIDGTLSPCRKVESEHTAADTKNEYNTVNYVLIGFFVTAIVIAVLLCFYCMYHTTKSRCSGCISIFTMIRLSSNCIKREPEKSTSFTERNPSAPPFEDATQAVQPPVCTVVRTIVKDANQNATASESPYWVQNGDLDNRETHEPSENDALMNNDVVEYDETTQPSTWSPAPNNPNPQNFQNFANVLEMNQLNISQPNTSAAPVEQNTSSNNSGSDISINIPNNFNANDNQNSTRRPTHTPTNAGVNISINVLNNPQVTNNNVS